MNFTSVLKMSVIPLIILVLAVACGGICACRISGAESESLYEYFSALFVSQEKAGKGMLINSVCSMAVVWAAIAVSGTVLPGVLLNLAVVVYRGFISGYTGAGFWRIYGYRGILMSVAMLPETVIFLTALVFFSAISLKMSFFRHEQKKIFSKNYFLWVIIFLSIFCVVSVLQTFATTIFMSLLSRFL